MSAERFYSDAMPIGITKAVRALYPRIDRLRGYVDKKTKIESERKTVDITFLVPKDHPELKAHKAAVADLLKKKFGSRLVFEDGKAFEQIGPKRVPLALPFLDGDEDAAVALATDKDLSYLAGHYRIKADTTPNRNGVLDFAVFDARQRDGRGNPVLVTEPEAIRKLVYSGCFVAGNIAYGTKDANGGNLAGVKAYLKSVCFVGDGERIGFDRVEAQANMFAQVQGAVVEVDATGGATIDDEIPF